MGVGYSRAGIFLPVPVLVTRTGHLTHNFYLPANVIKDTDIDEW